MCRHLLLSAPPGQFDLVLGDLLNIVSGGDLKSVLSSEFVDGVRKEYEARHLLDIEDRHDDDGENALVVELRRELQRYVERAYGGKGVLCRQSVHTDNKHEIVVSLRCERLSLPNCHAGSWAASYVYDGSFLRGSATVQAHYFENGNVRLRSHRSFPPVRVDNGGDILARIQHCEDELSRDLRELYASVNDTTLKHMRRVLPVSRTKMDWNVRSHRVTKNLHSNFVTKSSVSP